jgi:hypothetical protein
LSQKTWRDGGAKILKEAFFKDVTKGFDLGVIPKKNWKRFVWCFIRFLGGKYREMEFGFVYFFIPMWFFGLSAINLLWNFHKSMLDRCLCLGLTGYRLVIFEIFLEQLQNLVFLLFFVFLFFIYFVSFVFLFLVLILSLEVCRLILHVSMISDIVMPKYFIMLFFLIFFAQNAHFFLCWA